MAETSRVTHLRISGPGKVALILLAEHLSLLERVSMGRTLSLALVGLNRPVSCGAQGRTRPDAQTKSLGSS